jgi:hypothetical protein
MTGKTTTQNNALFDTMTLDSKTCIANFGAVNVCLSLGTLQNLVDAVLDIKRKAHESNPSTHILNPSPDVHYQENGWGEICLDRIRMVYILTLRGICWEVNKKDLEHYIQNSALALLAAGTTTRLLQMIENNFSNQDISDCSLEGL